MADGRSERWRISVRPVKTSSTFRPVSALVLAAFALGVGGCADDPAVTVSEAPASDTVAVSPPTTNGADTGPIQSDEVDSVPTSESADAPVGTTGDLSVSGSAPPPGGVDAQTPDGIGDPFYPQMGNGGYDVLDYDLQLDVDVAENRLDARAIIAATATRELTSFNLDLHGLDVSSVMVDGSIATFERDGDELIITGANPVAARADFAIDISYSGIPEPIDDPAVSFDTVGWQNREGTVYVASEPSGAKSWFPSNNHPSDKATFTFEITADSALTAVANGVQTSLVDNGNTATTTWTMDDPMATYLAAVYIGEFELRESTAASGTRIRNYFPAALADDLEADFELTADVLAFYEDLFGAAYPFDEYGSIVLPFSTGFALENQSISVHGLDATDPDTVAHEILHQWAGDSVTVARWQDIWMLEGFATYLSYMYFEDRGLDSQFVPESLYRILESEETVGPAEVPIDEMFGLSVYLRGAMALHALRTEVGDDSFREILRTYYERNAGEQVSTDEFLAIVAELAGSDVVTVLDAWLYGTQLPPFP
jgi:aminopeptidase N